MSQVKFHVSGRDLVERGPLNIKPDQVEHYRQLENMGIGLDEIVQEQIAMDAALVGPAIGNLGSPLQFLQTWLPGIVRQVTSVRNIDKLIGVTTIGNWEDEEIVQTASELIGKAELYSDTANVPLANYNATYERRTVVRWEQGMLITKLEEARDARRNVNNGTEKRESVARSLDIIRNRVGFSGYNQPDTRCYGFLNDPNLPAYSNVPAGANGLPWSGKTFLEITLDIRSAVRDLVIASGGNVDPESDMLTLAIPLGFTEYMAVVSDFGVSVRQWLMENYPKIRIVSAPELASANGGANVFYLYADSVTDDSSDDGATFFQLVPARFMALGVEQKAKGQLEDFTNALAGVMVKRPWAVVRRSGI